MSLWGMGVMIGPIMGPILGGWLTENYTWRWIFFINLPFGIATTLGLLTFMDETEGDSRLSFDWLGFAALSIGIGALQLMLDRGEQLGWFDSTEIVVDGDRVGRGLLLLHRPLAHDAEALHFHRNLPRPQFHHRPRLHVHVRRPAGCLDGADGAVPAGRHGLSDHRRRACCLATRGIGMAFAMLMAGRLMTRVDPRLMLAFGLTCCTVSLYYSIDFAPDTADAHDRLGQPAAGLRARLSCSCRSTRSRCRP